MSGGAYQPKTGQRCHCKAGQHRDNCPDCEGTGWRIDFAKIRSRRLEGERPEGCTKGCTGRMCRDALNCDAKK